MSKYVRRTEPTTTATTFSHATAFKNSAVRRLIVCSVHDVIIIITSTRYVTLDRSTVDTGRFKFALHVRTRRKRLLLSRHKVSNALMMSHRLSLSLSVHLHMCFYLNSARLSAQLESNRAMIARLLTAETIERRVLLLLLRVAHHKSQKTLGSVRVDSFILAADNNY